MAGKRSVLPPVWLLLCLLATLALDYLLPIVDFQNLPVRIGGIVLVLFGILMSATAAGTFKKVGTPVIPFERSTTLVTSGWYRFTRNPMYLGMALSLLGTALALGSVGAFLPLPAFVVLIEALFIRGEERFLEEIFGQQYRDFRARVRRWI
jgi:protein-S-isoprenylcysteine O-methyltransferase Ste14